MYKLKTHSGAKKRFKMTKNGHVKCAKPFRRHLLTKKSQKRKRGMRSPLFLKTCDKHHIVRLLPYE